MKKKKIIDIAMILILPFLMAFPLTQRRIHELLGMFMFLCFIVHHRYNRMWYKAMLKGNHTPIKKLLIGINMLLLFDIVFIFLSGITMSESIPFLNFMSSNMARKLHMLCTYWGSILMAIHMGLHLEMMTVSLKRYVNKTSTMTRTLLSYLPYGIVVYGIFMFIKHQWIGYLCMFTQFVYVDASSMLFQLIFDNSSILFFFTWSISRLVANSKRTTSSDAGNKEN